MDVAGLRRVDLDEAVVKRLGYPRAKMQPYDGELHTLYWREHDAISGEDIVLLMTGKQVTLFRPSRKAIWTRFLCWLNNPFVTRRSRLIFPKTKPAPLFRLTTHPFPLWMPR